jgi:hypothetical protein
MLWIALARLRVEPSQTSVFFDDWSHSFVSVLVLAIVLASFFWRLDRVVALAAWWAVFSHFVLDFPVHPKQLALYPLAKLHLGWNLLPWGSSEGYFGFTKYWSLQSIVLLVLLVIYLTGMRKLGGPRRRHRCVLRDRCSSALPFAVSVSGLLRRGSGAALSRY